jgi:trk system potassium uptake protein TrkH
MVKVIAIMFMLTGALPFALYVRAMHGDTKSIAKDTQVHVFFGILIIIVAVVFLGNNVAMVQTNTVAALKDTSFALVSLLTTTGFTGVDYMTWSPVGLTMVFFAIFVGGCAGSTSGGIKIFRLQIIASLGRMQVFRLLQPHGVYIPYFNRKPIANTVMESVTGFFFFYILFYVALAMILSFMGLDMLTALSGAASALSNVGPAMGDIIGPTGTYAPLPDAAKWLLSIAMLLGRLEFFTVLVLLTPAFWKH